MFFHARWMIRIPRVQRHFHISHNTPDLPSQILLNLCLFISPGYYSRPKRNWKQCLCKIFFGEGGGANKVRYVENVEMANERVHHAALSHRVSWEHGFGAFMANRCAVLWCGRSFWVETAHSNFPCFALCRKATPTRRNNEKQNRLKWPWIEHRLHRKGNNKPKFT